MSEHFISATCEGEQCGHEVGDNYCGQPATHKVGEEIAPDDPHKRRHNLTVYVCCEHFGQILGDFAREICGTLQESR
jgi:3-deoxy-D-manno-octulosonate 8-phosphate phosphatase KdsC-like HAD superfamily phosphatase